MTYRLGYLIIALGWIVFIFFLANEYFLYGSSFLRRFISPQDFYEFFINLLMSASPIVFTIIGLAVNGRLKLLESIREIESKYLDLYENAPVGYHSLGPDATILEVNNTWLQMFGYRREDIVGKVKFTDLILEKYKDYFSSYFSIAKEKGEVKDLRYEMRKNDGTYLPVLISAYAVYDSKGNFLRTRTVVKDNSLQVTYENTLKESAREWRNTLDTLPEGIVVVDKDFIIRKMNKRMTEILNVSFTEAIGKKYPEIYSNVQEYLRDNPIQEVKEKLTPIGREIYNPELNKHFLVNFTPILDEQGEIQHIVQTMVDISDIMDREKKLKESRLAFYNMLKDVDMAYKELKELHNGLILALAKAVDAKSPWTKNHSELVARYSVMIGKELGLNAKEMETLKVAAILHDIGKIGVYDSILYKPGRLTHDEYALIKLHSERGAEIIGHIQQLEEIAKFIKYHHERFDGTGYPEGLKDGQIPLYSRIIAVADAYEAMTSDRPYRPVLSAEEAIEELNRFAGTQFDPDLVSVFIKTLN